MSKRRVVITGVGVISPLGHDLEQTWKGVSEGRSGIERITLFDASTYPTKIAGEVKNFDFEESYLMKDPVKDLRRNTQFAMIAAQMALADSGLEIDKNCSPEKCGVYLGGGEGPEDFENFMELVHLSSTGDSIDGGKFVNLGTKSLCAIGEFEQEPSMSSMHIASAIGAIGPNQNCLTACAASSQAIGEASEIIRRGDADVMVSGGTHTMLHPLGMIGFNLLTAISTSFADQPGRASRPFDRNRDGFILGEGSGILILEELEHAKKRRATIYGELIGYGSTADSYRVTDSHPEGRGAIAAIEMALRTAKIEPQDVGYINAHGTSTQVNDYVETKAIKEVFKDHAYKVPVSSIKSTLGHLIAAAGAVELMTCLMVIRDNVLPPTINYETPDPECDLDYIPNVAREKRIDIALSNSFGFGGQNITLAVKRFSE